MLMAVLISIVGFQGLVVLWFCRLFSFSLIYFGFSGLWVCGYSLGCPLLGPMVIGFPSVRVFEEGETGRVGLIVGWWRPGGQI